MKQREFNRRELRGLAIVAKGGMIKKLSEKAYLVSSSEFSRWYKVSWNGEGWICECDDFTKRKKPCKHVYAVLFLNRLPFILIANHQTKSIRCPKCNSDRIIRKGFVHGKNFSSQRYMCKDCFKPKNWWARRDLNPRPTGYEPVALPC